MIRWCAFCQTYLGEVPPYEDFRITHVLCPACQSQDELPGEDAIARVRPLVAFFDQVRASASTPTQAAQLLAQGLSLGVQPASLLMGMLQPALYEIGLQWERGQARVHEEHQLTATCSEIVRLVRERLASVSDLRQSPHPRVLLTVADGNYHTLGIEIVELLALSRGAPTYTVLPGVPPGELAALVERLRPGRVGIGVSLGAQLEPALAAAAAIARVPVDPRPEVVAGGFAIREGLQVPGSPLRACTDIDELLR